VFWTNSWSILRNVDIKITKEEEYGQARQMLRVACGNNGKAKIKIKRIKERSEIVWQKRI
jgi:hypothetical protein